MEYREIMYIRTITKCKSITKAADSLYIAQPSLSQALHRVEEYYGAEFFWRTKAGLVITDAGKAYLDAADKMEKLYNDAKEELKNSPEKMGRICYFCRISCRGSTRLFRMWSLSCVSAHPLH